MYEHEIYSDKPVLHALLCLHRNASHYLRYCIASAMLTLALSYGRSDYTILVHDSHQASSHHAYEYFYDQSTGSSVSLYKSHQTSDARCSGSLSLSL
jgi:hypothetical protein